MNNVLAFTNMDCSYDLVAEKECNTEELGITSLEPGHFRADQLERVSMGGKRSEEVQAARPLRFNLEVF